MRVALDELPAGFYFIAHEHGKGFVHLHRVFQDHL